jgi:hypothetical protein
MREERCCGSVVDLERHAEEIGSELGWMSRLRGDGSSASAGAGSAARWSRTPPCIRRHSGTPALHVSSASAEAPHRPGANR